MFESASNYGYEKGGLYLGQSPNADHEAIGITTERHAITIAGAGAGKGACVINPNLLKWPHNALVIDPKGEAAVATAEAREKMGQAVHVLDPFNAAKVDKRFRASFNFLDGLDPKSMTIKEDIEAISDGIVKRDNPESSHWDDGAQTIISGLIAYVVLKRPKKQRTLLEVRRILRNGDEFAKAIAAMKSLKGCAGLCESGASAAYAKEGGYFVSNAEKNTRWLDSKAMEKALGSSSFKLSDLKNGKATVYLVLPANYLGQHGRFLRLFVRGAIEEMARRTPAGELRGAQCLFLLDEFFALGYIDEIAKAAGLMRGYGLQLWPILQDLGQLITLYGQEGSETFFGNADLHQFFGNTDQMTLEHISMRIGKKSIDMIPLPPVAPAITGGGQSVIGSMMGASQKTSTRVMGAGWSAISGAVTQAVAAEQQAQYQNEMNAYNRAMAEFGKPLMTENQVARMVERKDDVVANAAINFVFGSHCIRTKPWPYFRDEPHLDLQTAYREEYDHPITEQGMLLVGGVLCGGGAFLSAWLTGEGVPALIFGALIGAILTSILAKLTVEGTKQEALERAQKRVAMDMEKRGVLPPPEPEIPSPEADEASPSPAEPDVETIVAEIEAEGRRRLEEADAEHKKFMEEVERKQRERVRELERESRRFFRQHAPTLWERAKLTYADWRDGML